MAYTTLPMAEQLVVQRFSRIGLGEAMLGVTDRFCEVTDQFPLANTVELNEAALAVDFEVKQLCAGLTEEQLSWRPCAERWSIAQNLAHLRTTTQVFLPAVDSALAASRMMGLRGDGPFRLSPFGRFIVWRLDARPILKMQAPKILRPHMLQSAELELQHFLASQMALRQRISECDCDLGKQTGSDPGKCSGAFSQLL